jgi:peptidoglycan/LPS O-acetylase OafA/YrhL
MAQRHFVFLDDLRGVAAAMVAYYHICNMCQPFAIALPHAYLAVDFFFCLSGLVLAQAYDQRLRAGLSRFEFLKRRAIRLWPMIAVGAGLSGIALFFVTDLTPQAVWLYALSNLFLLPSGFIWPVYGGVLGEAYPGNNPLWSLFFECLASVLFALGIGARLQSRKAALVVLSFLAVLLSIVILKDSTVSTIGFATPEGFVHGTVRVLFSFAGGVFIFRLKLLEKIPAVPQWLIVLALVGVFALPVIKPNSIIDILAVLIVLPLIVMFGAASQGSSVRTQSWLGRLSYPFYLIHMPVILLMDRYLVIADLPAYGKAALIMLTAIGVSYAALVLYDEPLRAWLMARRQKPAASGVHGRVTNPAPD